MVASLHVEQAASPEQISLARILFQEYGASLGFSLCFQNFDKELAGLPGNYAPPNGRLLIAYLDSEAAGCVALHQFGPGIAEMKRLYVRPGFRGKRVATLRQCRMPQILQFVQRGKFGLKVLLQIPLCIRSVFALRKIEPQRAQRCHYNHHGGE